MSDFMAEGVGFEPTDALTSPVFKTGAFDHSATLPEDGIIPKLVPIGFNLYQKCHSSGKNICWRSFKKSMPFSVGRMMVGSR